MASCSNCGFEMDGGQPPPRCPRCGAATGPAGRAAPPPPPPGPPPASSYDADAPSGNTLFGVPDAEDVDSLTELPTFTPPASTRGAPRPGKPSAFKPPTVGPPTVGPPTVGRPPTVGPPPVGSSDDAIPSLPDFPAAHAPGVTEFEADTFGGGDALELDLPAPSRGGGDLSMPSTHDDDLDLPTPSGPAGGPGMPPPPPAFHGDLDLGEGDLDLPAPGTHRRSTSDLDLPAPAGLDLPAPSDFNLPAPRDGGAPGLDLPAPVELDLPAPAGQDLRPAGQELRPAGQELRPAGQELQPADMGVAPTDLGMLEPRRPGAAPAVPGAPQGSRTGTGAMHGSVPAEAPIEQRSPYRSPTPKAIGEQSVSRGVLYGAAALLVVGGLGAGLFYGGVFDAELSAEGGTAGRGVTKQPSAAGDAELAERSAEVLVKFKSDTPQAYQDAIELAQQSGDVVGQAEAALLMDLRYGPDSVLRAQGSKLLEPYVKNEAPHVQRVVGLSKLAAGDHAGAQAALKAEDDLRTRLYRGYLRLSQDRPKDAIADAKSVLDIDGGELAALYLHHAAQLRLDALAAREAIAKSLKDHPDHAGLQELAVEAGIETGYLAEAAEVAKQLQPPSDASANYRARILTLRGRLAAARGDFPRAISRLEEALNVAPKAEAAQLALTRTLLQAGELLEASQMIRSAVAAHPESIDANLLQVEALIASGDGDEALALAQELGKKLPDRPEPPYLEGKVQSMRLQLEDGSAAFARAREKDPAFYDAAIAEAKMLAAGRKPTEALDKLAAAVKDARVGEASPSVIADLLVERARLLLDQEQPRAAVTALDEALTALPSHNDAQTLRGVLALQSGDVDKGQADLKAVYERTGGYPGMTAPLGRLLAQQGEVEALRELVGDQADDPRASIELKLVGARLALLQGDAEKAKSLSDEVLVREPNNWEAQVLMAEAFRMSGDFAEALEKIEGVRPPTPRAEVHFFRGRILEFNYKSDEARAEYQRALELDPNLHEARFLYGRLLAYQGLSKQALGELDTVIDATGDQFPMAYMARGIARKELGQHEQAIADYDKSLELDPGLAEAHYWKGRSLFTLNRDKAATAAFEAATEAELPEGAGVPDWYLGALVGLGESRIQIGQKAAAKAPLQKYLELAPANHPQRSTAERKLAEVQ